MITGALNWYDEPEWQLRDCVNGLALSCDRIVALDGAYKRYPGGKPRSPMTQVNAIRRAAHRNGIDCLILQPDHLWEGQLEKRTYLMNIAAVGSDWIATVDADHIIVKADKKALNRELDSLDLDCVEVTYHTPENPDRSFAESAAGLWHQQQSGTSESLMHLFRALPQIQLEHHHYWYSALKKGERVWMWTDQGNPKYPILPHHQLKTEYVVEHRCLFREPKQILANRAFCNDRELIVEETGQEDHVPEIPRRDPDFERIPR